MWKGRLSLRYSGSNQLSPLNFIRGWLQGIHKLDECIKLVGTIRAPITMNYIKKKFYTQYKESVGYRKLYVQTATKHVGYTCDRGCHCRTDGTFVHEKREIMSPPTDKLEQHFKSCNGRTSRNKDCPMCKNYKTQLEKWNNGLKMVETKDLPANQGIPMSCTLKKRSKALNPFASEYRPSKRTISSCKLQSLLDAHDHYREVALTNLREQGYCRPSFAMTPAYTGEKERKPLYGGPFITFVKG